jgi:hypothetical protein
MYGLLQNERTKHSEREKKKKKRKCMLRQYIEYNIFDEMFRSFRGQYHGGSFNDVKCRRLMLKVAEISKERKKYFLTLTQDPQLMQDIKEMSAKLTALFQGFEVGFDVLRKNYGTVKDADYERLERMVKAVDKIWTELGLSKTPKYHTWMHHVVSQLKLVEDYACMLEDDEWRACDRWSSELRARSSEL